MSATAIPSTVRVIDGRRAADELKVRVREQNDSLRASGTVPGLATIRVGDQFSSVAYERRLGRIAKELDAAHLAHRLPESISQAALLDVVGELNADPTVHGILVLRSLPTDIDEATIFRAISPEKDVEAVHPENAGLLALGVPRFIPSTAGAAFHLLDRWVDETQEDRDDFYHRSHIVVVGRSNNVGKPCVSLAYERGATVESIDEWASHVGTFGRHTRRADILLVAAGRPKLVKAEHIAEGAVVIDIGINPVEGPDGVTRMAGDVDFESVASRAVAITPVPGGVGPVTDVWLFGNVLEAARVRR